MSKKTTLLPRLRFPEFILAGEWQAYRLDEIADRLTNKVGNKQLTTLSVSVGMGFVSQADKFSRDISGKQYKNYVYLKEGDFSYNKGNSKKFPQGCIYELNEYDEAAVPNAFISFRFHNGYVPNFYKGYFDNNFHGKQLLRFITSGARMNGLLNINPSDFFRIILPTPREEAEQQKIADCLSSLDDLIIAEKDKLETLKTHKKGLMQKLFPAEGKSLPEWRFLEFKNNEKWQTAELGAIFVNRQETNSSLTLMSLTEDSGIIPQSDSNKKDTSNSNKSKYLKICIGDVVYNTMRMWQGRCAYVDIEGIVSPAYTVCTPKANHSGLFFCYYFKTSNMIRKFHANSQGLVSDTLSIKYDAFSKIATSCPEELEQQKIAGFLLNLDNLIKSQTEKIEELKLHKKGLMQGLFPSVEEITNE